VIVPNAMCYGFVSKTVTDTERCEHMGKPTCPMQRKEWKKLYEAPCCYAIFIPARFLTEYKTRPLAARKYVEQCLLESTPPSPTQE